MALLLLANRIISPPIYEKQSSKRKVFQNWVIKLPYSAAPNFWRLHQKHHYWSYSFHSFLCVKGWHCLSNGMDECKSCEIFSGWTMIFPFLAKPVIWVQKVSQPLENSNSYITEKWFPSFSFLSFCYNIIFQITITLKWHIHKRKL